MSYARGFGQNGQALYANVTKPTLCFLNFVVDSTNGNGLGIRSLKSNGYVENVFMHTSATPGKGNAGYTNPNPAVGYILVQMKQNFNYFLGAQVGFATPVSGSTKIDNSALTVGAAYVITTLGNATVANWQSIGVPVNITPAVGVSFIATAVGVPGEANTSTSRVMAPTTSNAPLVEVVGDTATQISNNVTGLSGQWITFQVSAATGSSTTTLIPANPANNSVCGMQLWFDASTVTIDGI